jgi:hypothetical protein
VATKKAITFHPLDNSELMAAAGRMLIRHSNLDYQLKMLIRKLAGVTPEEARRAFAYVGSQELRKLVNAHATREFGIKSPLLIKIQALLAECREATDRRNEYVHLIWAKEFGLGDKSHLFGADSKLKPFPTKGALDKLDKEIARLVNELGNANLGALIAQEMKKKTPTPGA